MILSFQELRRVWRNKTVRFDPAIEERQIGLSSIDLRLGFRFAWLKEKAGLIIKPATDGFLPTDLIENQDLEGMTIGGRPATLRMRPHEFVIGQTLETVVIPHDLAAQVQGKSSLARAGLSIHATAPHIHPGWAGRITLEMFNSGPWELEFEPGKDLICQLILFQVSSKVPKKVADKLATFVGQQTPWPPKRR